MLSIKNLELAGKRVLIRVDFNVPLDSDGQITDDTRIVRSVNTIRYVLEQGGIPILMSHMGRPKGQWQAKLSLSPCAQRLSELLDREVLLAPDAVGPQVEAVCEALQPGQLLLLENLRFHQGEEHPEREPSFVDGLQRLGDLYINDAFGTAHRAHASTVALAKRFPGKAAPGFLLQQEITYLGDALMHPKRPLVAIIGGAKVSSKLGVLKSLSTKVDSLMIGGGMAYTFFKARGLEIGDSLCELDLIDAAREFEQSCKVPLLLPADLVIADKFANDAKSLIMSSDQDIPKGWMGMDIGPKTLQQWTPTLLSAATIFWNGPLGVFEFPHFSKGTFEMAGILSQAPGTTIVGGGDSVAAINQSGVSSQISHLSTGGGAVLEYIEYGTLPGLQALAN